MRAVLIAATLAAIAAPAFADSGWSARRTIGLQPPKACNRQEAQKVSDQRGVAFKRLDELPWAVLEHAVLRSVGGCPVREVVYQGRTYWVEPAAPSTNERITPAIGQTAPTQK